jgi:hypothetical protein
MAMPHGMGPSLLQLFETRETACNVRCVQALNQVTEGQQVNRQTLSCMIGLATTVRDGGR